MSHRIGGGGGGGGQVYKTLTIYRHGIKPRCATDVILLNLGDESSFCQELVYLIRFEN